MKIKNDPVFDIYQELLRVRQFSKELVSRLHPVLKENRSFRYLFDYLAFGPHILDVDTGFVRLPREVLSRFMGVSCSHAQTGKFLEEYKKQVSPSFCYRDYYHQGEKDRQVICTGIEELSEQMFSWDDEYLYLYDLSKVTPRKTKSAFIAIREFSKIVPYLYPEQQKIADYLHDLPYSYFQKAMKENGEKAYTLAWNYQGQISYINSLKAMPFPIYLPSRKEGALTPRIFDRAASFLKKEIRHELFPNAIDLDLKNCQLVILNMLSPIKSLNEFLLSGESVWPLLLEIMQIPKELQPLAKPHIKEAVYSSIFGMNAGMVEYNLTVNFANKKKNNGIEIPKLVSLVQTNILKDIHASVKILQEKIRRDEGMESAFGFIKYEGGNIDSFLACNIHTYELTSIVPCYDVALEMKKSNHDDFFIMLHQHDGISIELKNNAKKALVVKRLQKAVTEKALKYGMAMNLEID